VVEQIVTREIHCQPRREGGRADCYPEKCIVNQGVAEVDNDISRGNNLLYHPLSYVLFALLH
jgi:hypothetical protein